MTEETRRKTLEMLLLSTEDTEHLTSKDIKMSYRVL